MICSPGLLNGELARIPKIFESNAYPGNIIKYVIDSKIRQFKEPAVLGPSRWSIYLKLPLIDRKCQLLTEFQLVSLQATMLLS